MSIRYYLALFVFLVSTGIACADDYAVSSSSQIQSVTAEGGPIWTKHLQSGKVNANQDHGLAIAKVSTKDYGNWGIYYLSPNSVDRTSIGAGYVTDPYTIPLGPTKLELSGAFGLVTGYDYAVVPLIAAQARLVLYQHNNFDAGFSVAALPYIMEDKAGKNKFGIVATTPFLSLRYKFD